VPDKDVRDFDEKMRELEPWLRFEMRNIREFAHSETKCNCWWGLIRGVEVKSVEEGGWRTKVLLEIVVPFGDAVDDEEKSRIRESLEGSIVLVVAPPSKELREAINDVLKYAEQKLGKFFNKEVVARLSSFYVS